MTEDDTATSVLARVAPLMACALLFLAVLDVTVGLKGEPVRLAVLIGGAVLFLVLPRLQKFSIGKDGVSAELIQEAINSAKDASEKSQQLLLQGAGSAQTARAAAARSAVPPFDIYAYVDALDAPKDQADPQKGRFGDLDARDGWRVAARATGYNADEGILSFDVVVTGPKISQYEQVYFVLHPSFTPSIYVATMRNGRASIFLRSWGSFTLGVVADQGAVGLELDLSAKLEGAPSEWRLR